MQLRINFKRAISLFVVRATLVVAISPAYAEMPYFTVDPMVDVHRFNSDLMYYNLYCNPATKLFDEQPSGTTVIDGQTVNLYDGKPPACPAHPDCPKLSCSAYTIVSQYAATQAKFLKADTADDATTVDYAGVAGYDNGCVSVSSIDDLNRDMFHQMQQYGQTKPACIQGGTTVAGEVDGKVYRVDSATAANYADVVEIGTTARVLVSGSGGGVLGASDLFSIGDTNGDGIIDIADANKGLPAGAYVRYAKRARTINEFYGPLEVCKDSYLEMGDDGYPIGADTSRAMHSLSPGQSVAQFFCSLYSGFNVAPDEALYVEQATSVAGLDSSVMIGRLNHNGNPVKSNTDIEESDSAFPTYFKPGVAGYDNFSQWASARAMTSNSKLKYSFQFDNWSCEAHLGPMKSCEGQSWTSRNTVEFKASAKINVSASCTYADGSTYTHPTNTTTVTSTAVRYVSISDAPAGVKHAGYWCAGDYTRDFDQYDVSVSCSCDNPGDCVSQYNDIINAAQTALDNYVNQESFQTIVNYVTGSVRTFSDAGYRVAGPITAWKEYTVGSAPSPQAAQQEFANARSGIITDICEGSNLNRLRGFILEPKNPNTYGVDFRALASKPAVYSGYRLCNGWGDVAWPVPIVENWDKCKI